MKIAPASTVTSKYNTSKVHPAPIENKPLAPALEASNPLRQKSNSTVTTEIKKNPPTPQKPSTAPKTNPTRQLPFAAFTKKYGNSESQNSSSSSGKLVKELEGHKK